MQKNENPVVLAVILFLITASVALLLSYTNLLTKDKITENTVLEQTKARAEVMTDAESFEKIELLPYHSMAKEKYQKLKENINNLEEDLHGKTKELETKFNNVFNRAFKYIRRLNRK